jgi:hypothetical protein
MRISVVYGPDPVGCKPVNETSTVSTVHPVLIAERPNTNAKEVHPEAMITSTL